MLGLGNVVAGALLSVDVRWRGADGKMRSWASELTPGWDTVWLGLEPSEGTMIARPSARGYSQTHVRRHKDSGID
jgi:hypothetical protein